MRDFALSAAPMVAVFWVSFGLGVWLRPKLEMVWDKIRRKAAAAKAQE